MNKLTKKVLIIICSILIVVAIVVGVLIFNFNKFNLDISGSKITQDTYVQIMHDKVSDVSKYFKEKGSNGVNKEFWTKEIDGQVPYKVLTDKTMEQLKLITATYQIAEEKGYIEKGSLENIWQRLDQENKSRKEKIKKGQPVYGLAEYDMDTFLEYEMDTLQKLYCENEDNEGMKISEEERQKYYDKHKSNLFVKNDDISISYIKVDFEQLGLSEEEQENYKSMMKELDKNLNGRHLQDAVKDYPQLNELFEHIDLKSAEVSSYTKVIPDILDYAYELNQNEMTDVIDENGCLYLIECTDRVDYDYQPLETVRDNIDKILREDHYNEIVKKRADKLVVNVKMDKLYNFTKRNI